MWPPKWVPRLMVMVGFKRHVHEILRLATLPVRFVLSGRWIPSGPWVVLWTTLAVVSSIQTYEQIVVLGWRLLKLQIQSWRGKGGDASPLACELCDAMIALVLKFDAVSPGDVDCLSLCGPLKGKCVAMCENIVAAIDSSAHYPCVAAGICTEEKEEECSWNGHNCIPMGMCRRTRRLFGPRCEPHPGFKLWTQYRSSFQKHAGALASAIVNQPRCGERGAHPVFCVKNQVTNLDVMCETLTHTLILVVGIARSVHAIETPGGADAKHFLTFWIMTITAGFLETNLLKVLLSRLRFYYVLKLAVVAYLLLFDGAAHVYHRIRKARYKLTHSHFWRRTFFGAAKYQKTRRRIARRTRRLSASPLELFNVVLDDSDSDSDDDECEAVACKELEAHGRLAGLAFVADRARKAGVKAAYQDAIAGDLGRSARDALLEFLEHKELAFLYVKLHHAKVIVEEEEPEDDDAAVVVPLHAASAPAGIPVKKRMSRSMSDPQSPGSPTRRFFDKKHDSEARDVSVTSSFYVVLHLVPSPEAKSGSRDDSAAARAAKCFLQWKQSDDDNVVETTTTTTPGGGGLWPLVQRIYTRWRKSRLSEIFLGFFEDDALVSVSSTTVRGGPNLAPTWEEDLELKLVGGTIGPDGAWLNPCCCYTSLLVQLWVADLLHPDHLLGEATVPLADVMHGIPSRLHNLYLSDGVDKTASADLSLRLSHM